MRKAMRLRKNVIKFAIVSQLVIDGCLAWHAIENLEWQSYASNVMNEMARSIQLLT
ncbi:hypothetical protein ACKFKF_29785 [Phormidesmis sp. 146-12]